MPLVRVLRPHLKGIPSTFRGGQNGVCAWKEHAPAESIHESLKHLDSVVGYAEEYLGIILSWQHQWHLQKVMGDDSSVSPRGSSS